MNHQSEPESPTGIFQGLRKTKLLVMRGIGLIVSSFLLVLIFRKMEPGALWDTLKQAEGKWMVASILTFGIHLLFASYRWHLMLRLSKSTVHPGATIRAVTLGHCFNTFLFGAAGGDLVKSMIYARWYRLRLTEVLAMAPLDRFFGLSGALIFGLSMVSVGFFSGGFTAFKWEQLRLPIFWAIGLVFFLMAGMWGLSKWHGKGTSKFGLFLNHLRQGGVLLWNHPRSALKAASAATVVHLCLSLVMVFNLKAVSDAPFVWWNVLWIFPVISMISGLPVSIGGAGLREGTAMILLGLYAIPGEDAVTAALLTLGVYFLWAFIGLIVWQHEESKQQQALPVSSELSVSLVIPALNEADQMESLAAHLEQNAAGAEWILVDGGSQDGTLQKAQEAGLRTVQCKAGRGTQMHRGATVASGDVVLFLHADTRLPPNGMEAMLRCLKDKRVVGGGFWKRFDKPHWMMMGSTLRCLPRIFFGRYVFGDQGLFVRRSILESVGGVPQVPLMEEFELCRLLRTKGRLALADATVQTSSRRFYDKGVFSTYLLMGRIMLGYWLGRPPESLANLYRRAEKR